MKDATKFEKGKCKLYMAQIEALDQVADGKPIRFLKIGHSTYVDATHRFDVEETFGHYKLVRILYSAIGKEDLVKAVEESFKRRYPRQVGYLKHNFHGISEILSTQPYEGVKEHYLDPLYELQAEWKRDPSFVPDYVIDADWKAAGVQPPQH